MVGHGGSYRPFGRFDGTSRGAPASTQSLMSPSRTSSASLAAPSPSNEFKAMRASATAFVRWPSPNARASSRCVRAASYGCSISVNRSRGHHTAPSVATELGQSCGAGRRRVGIAAREFRLGAQLAQRCRLDALLAECFEPPVEDCGGKLGFATAQVDLRTGIGRGDVILDSVQELRSLFEPTLRDPDLSQLGQRVPRPTALIGARHRGTRSQTAPREPAGSGRRRWPHLVPRRRAGHTARLGTTGRSIPTRFR